MTREELRNDYCNEICELCYQKYFISRAYPETLCEGIFCEDAEYGFADEHNLKLEE